MNWRYILCLACIVPFETGGLTPGWAASSQDVRWCHGEDNPTADQKIAGCSAIIKQESDKEAVAYAYNARGGQYYYKGLHKRAIRDYDQAIRLNRNFAHAINNRCWARAVIGRLHDALKDCNRAITLQPQVGNTYENRAMIYLKMGQLKSAIADYDAALKLDPDSADDLYGRGIAKLKSGDVAGGRADIEAGKAKKSWVVEEFIRYGIRAP